ncbi:MAG: hypothetical protein ACRDY3_06110 [Acidimicrobiales bacterium]
MTSVAGSLQEPGEDQRAALCRAVATWVGQSAGEGEPVPAAGDVEVVDVVLLHPGRPGVLDVVAGIGGRLAHAVLGLRRPGDELHVLGAVESPVVGLVEDEHGLAVAVDAVHDAEVARLLLGAVGGPADDPGVAAVSLERETGPAAGPSVNVSVGDGDESAVLVFGDRCTLRVFPWLRAAPHPGVAYLAALDEAGFNHLAAPIVVWRRDQRDLGVVQELLVGKAAGWALALSSLRDLCASDGAPEEAGGDFASEARALGVMTARMHLAADRAFGRRAGVVAEWVAEAESAIADVDAAALDGAIGDTLRSLRSSELRAPALRAHGDLHLGRTARTDQGWVLADCMPGGTREGSGEPVYRSPLADVADLLWSLHHAAVTAAAELGRDPAGHAAAAELAAAWEARNRRAFVAGYLSTAGVGGLVPTDRAVVRDLVAVFELHREARLAARR